MSKNQRYLALAGVVVAVVIAIVWLDDGQTGIASEAEIDSGAGGSIIEAKSTQYPRAREIVNPSGFVNTDGEPITVEQYIGNKVVLVDFWTYSCINCQRTLPYLTAWHEKYKDHGLVILGIHTPEFAFEEKIENVRDATEQFSVEYPVVLDNEYGTWAAYQNRYWPRKYLIDIDGFVVYDHIGEGSYAETERVIQELLEERAERLGEDPSAVPEGIVEPGAEQVDHSMVRTPEIYFGAMRNSSHLGNGGVAKEGEQDFSLPEELSRDKVHLRGTWDITPEFARSAGAENSIMLPFQAQKVFFVARSEAGATVRVLLDGEPVGAEARGEHVSEDGTVNVGAEMLYRLIDMPEHGEHTLEIIVEEGVLDAFTFTFG